MLSASGNLFKCHEEVLYLQPLIPPTKRFDISPSITGGCSEGLGVCSDFSLNTKHMPEKGEIQPEYGDEQADDAERDCRICLARPNPQTRTETTGKYSFSLFS